MKKFFAILMFWLACLVPSISEGEEDKVYFSPEGCTAFAQNAAFLTQTQQEKQFKTGKELFDFVYPKGFLDSAPEVVQKLSDVLSKTIVKDAQEKTVDEIIDIALKFCYGNKGDIQEMIEQLQRYVGETGI